VPEKIIIIIIIINTVGKKFKEVNTSLVPEQGRRKFARPPCWCDGVSVIIGYGFGISSCGVPYFKLCKEKCLAGPKLTVGPVC
jgi:hypothetical protein